MEGGGRIRLVLAAAGIAGLAVVARLPFVSLPLTIDGAGYAEVARQWARGATLYEDVWVDRPQSLLLVFRGLLHVGGGSTETFRIAAALAGAVLAVLVFLVALRLAGRRAAVAAGVLAAVAGSSPYIEAFTLNGELLAAIPATAAILAFIVHQEREQAHWLVLAGLLAGFGLTLKQSAVDPLLAISAMLVLTQRRRALPSVLLFAGAALVPLAVSAAAASSPEAWWYAVVGYRGDGDSLLTGPLGYRIYLFLLSVPVITIGLGFLLAAAALGRSRTPRLVHLWTLGAVVGILGGGNFHAHYFIQLVPPLAVAGGIFVAHLFEAPRRARLLPVAALSAAAAVTLAATVPAYIGERRERTIAVFRSEHPLIGEWAAEYLEQHSAPDDPVLVVPGEPIVHYLTERPPLTPYLWYSNVRSIPGAMKQTLAIVAERRAAYIVVSRPAYYVDPSGELNELLIENYRIVARRGPSSILARRAVPRPVASR
ncbi:MAG: glycosyltransferase family 39 protein [Gaiellaceae bacterium]